jgi:16S rRNA (guanine966-N2)-methyltransferase
VLPGSDVLLRIISGRLRGRTIRAPGGRGTRPTASRVREAIFDVLAHSPTHARTCSGARVLDLFAGSGAMGIEALSRGADHAHFVERDRRAVTELRENLEALGLTASATVLPVAADQAIRRLEAERSTFELVFLDPPYAAVRETEALLRGLVGSTLLARPSLVVLEHAADVALPPIEGLGPSLDRRWGDTEAVFYRHD